MPRGTTGRQRLAAPFSGCAPAPARPRPGLAAGGAAKAPAQGEERAHSWGSARLWASCWAVARHVPACMARDNPSWEHAGQSPIALTPTAPPSWELLAAPRPLSLPQPPPLLPCDLLVPWLQSLAPRPAKSWPLLWLWAPAPASALCTGHLRSSSLLQLSAPALRSGSHRAGTAWGQPHLVAGGGCFCAPSKAGGLWSVPGAAPAPPGSLARPLSAASGGQSWVVWGRGACCPVPSPPGSRGRRADAKALAAAAS